ncbi:MAG: hypothetical protein HKN92_10200 [Chitinophagales bacterium]|nr:hypothetical protein [Chitinophagales bacterium]
MTLIILNSKFATIFVAAGTSSFVIVGAVMVAFAGFAYWVSNFKNINQDLVKVVTGLDIIWVVASIIVVATNSFHMSFAGLIITSLLALIVAVFAFLQHTGLKAYISHLPEGRG